MPSRYFKVLASASLIKRYRFSSARILLSESSIFLASFLASSKDSLASLFAQKPKVQTAFNRDFIGFALKSIFNTLFLYSIFVIGIDPISSHSLTKYFSYLIFDRIACNAINKIDSVLKLIVDENGEIDIVAIGDEMINNLITAKSREYNDIIDGLVIGDGKICIPINFINKKIVLTHEDIKDMIAFINSNYCHR